MRDLAGLGVIVTGAARGIGLAIAERFVEERARVYLCDVDESALSSSANAMPSEFVIGHSVCDVGDSASVATMVAAAEKALGGIDVLVNNAGIAFLCTPVLDVSVHEWDETLRVNLRGPFLVSQLVAKTMFASGRRGSIINISSTNGLVAEVGFAAYNASKAGLLLLSQTLAVELAPIGIRVNAVCPGYIVTPLSLSVDESDSSFVEAYVQEDIPLGRTGLPEDIAAACAFLASSDSSYITGTALVVDGGQLAHSGTERCPRLTPMNCH